MKRLANFPSAVLTGIDERGYPFSVRCKPIPDGDAQVLRLQLVNGIGIQPGSACLLCHRHDEKLWNIKSFNVHGTLEQNSQGWILRPHQFIPGTVSQDLIGFLRLVMVGRRNAKRYLEKRGLPRPKIPWDEIAACWAQTKRARATMDLEEAASLRV